MLTIDFRKLILDMGESKNKGMDFAINAGKTAGIILLTVLFSMLLAAAHTSSDLILLLYFFVVFIISMITPRFAYGIMAAVFASLAYLFLVVEPYFGFTSYLQPPLTLAAMLVVTLLSSAFIQLLKLQAYRSVRMEDRTALLFQFNENLSDAQTIDEIIEIATDFFIHQMHRPSIVFLADPRIVPIEDAAPVRKGDTDIFFTQDELSAIHRLFLRGASETLLEDEELSVYYAPLIWNDITHGFIGVHCQDMPLTPWEVEFVHLICRQTAHALDLQITRDTCNLLVIDTEKEKTRGSLLSSISHDFRTPLTSILGASNAVLEQKDMLVEMRDSLLINIQENAKWLIRMVENILTVTQISQISMQLNKRLESAEEVIAQSVSIVRQRHPDYLIHVKVPDELMMIPMDATLIAQVIINLLLNAIKNSPGGSFVQVNLTEKDRFALFEVRDHGTGIPEHLLDRLFEIHTVAEEHGDGSDKEDDQSAFVPDPDKGIGIGLSICRTIIQAHGGIIEGHNRKEGGAKFSFWLPLSEESELPILGAGANR